MYRTKQDEFVLVDIYVKPGEVWEFCPRDALRRASKILKDEFDLVRRRVCLICWEVYTVFNFSSACTFRK